MATPPRLDGLDLDDQSRKPPSSQLVVRKHGFQNRLVNDGSIFGKVAQHSAFETLALILIMGNAVWIGVDLDCNDTGKNCFKLNVPSIYFNVVENIFCAGFLLEILIRLLAYRKMLSFFLDPHMAKWNLFDSVLVLLMVVENWVLPRFNFKAEQLKTLSSLRLLRLLRISRVFHLVPELGMMVKSMVAALRSVTSTLVLQVGIMYIFAIVLTQWAKSYGKEGKCVDGICFDYYFGSISMSLLALMQILVFDDTFEIVRPVMKERITIGLLLILYMCIASFTVLNMLIGVICDIVSSTTAREKEKVMRSRVEDLFEQIDEDGSGTITREEFENRNTIEHISKLGIDKNLLRNVFDIMDTDDDNNLEAKEFIDMMFTLIHPPKSQDILAIHARIDRLAELLGILSATKTKGPPVSTAKELGLVGGAVPRTRTEDTSCGGQADSGGCRPGPVPLTALVPALRLLTGQLHALQEECKAARADGGCWADGRAGPDSEEPPLENVIADAIAQLVTVLRLVPQVLSAEADAADGGGQGSRDAAGGTSLRDVSEA